ncbi:major facilitator superfamily domain-containing protein [Dichotomopilus funicola]|uniref:Major facilitator superfamily domain-containing protein n=1 Tax=Dichotomopilus funicola TaxID=1934379 RepID=A0AAN6ZIT8_9PEZI|nr:major facilitator superfamily domain-containing protein [Dichotomopilus funicola]
MDSSQTPYTTWTARNRTALVCLLGYLALASSLTANIYFPLLELLAERYRVSTQAVNLTITLYMVFQGIAPSFWSPLSDTFGRRPVYLATFSIYTTASLGLSIVDKSYPALLLLRAMQSIGGSAVLSLAYAVVADVTVHSERGRFLAPMLTATNIGPCIGPIIGGGTVLASGDPRWCFRALLIFGASAVLLIGFVQSETARTVVGNGAVPAKGLWRTWLSLLFAWREERKGNETEICPLPDHHQQERQQEQPDLENQTREKPQQSTATRTADTASFATGRGKLIIPNPLPSLRIVFHPDSFLALWLAGCPYALWFCVQTSITPIFGGGRNSSDSYQGYSFNPLQVGCCFLAGGLGIIAGGFIAGWLMDRNYRHVAREAGLAIDRVCGDDVAQFPIERARSRWSVAILCVSASFVVGYGWVVDRHAHPAVLLLLQGVLGCKCTLVHQTYSALVVDVFPQATGTAAAANNITRCGLAAAAVAMLDPLVRALGYGWVFTLLGLFDALSCVLAVITLRKWGHGWRNKRSERLKG